MHHRFQPVMQPVAPVLTGAAMNPPYGEYNTYYIYSVTSTITSQQLVYNTVYHLTFLTLINNTKFQIKTIFFKNFINFVLGFVNNKLNSCKVMV